MTVSSEVSSVDYDGDGSTRAFAIPFPFFSNADIQVSTRAANGDAAVISVGFAITGAGTVSRFCTFDTAPANTVHIVIERAPQLLQQTDYVENDRFPAATNEDDQDRQVMISQYLYRLLQGCLRFPSGDASIGALAELPPVSTRKSKNLGFDSLGRYSLSAVLASDTLSRSSIGSYLFPQEEGEGPASIVATSPWYKPHDLRRYGVVGDGVTDDTTALNAVGQGAWAQNVTFTCPPGFVMKTTDTVTFKAPYCALMMDPSSYIDYAGPADRAALVLGSDAAQFTGRDFNVSVNFHGNANDYLSHSCVGVQLRGAWAGNRVRLNSVTGFTCNWQFWASNAAGMAYNTFDLGISGNASYHLELRSAIANGFINENTFLNGDFQTFSSFVPGVNGTVHGIIFRNEPGAYVGHNKNHFIKPCFQLTQAGVVGERIPIIFADNGGYNQFQNCRFEGYNGELFRVTSDTVAVTFNTIDIGYQTTAYGTLTAYMTETDGGFSYGNRVTMAGRPLSERFHSGDLMLKAYVPSAGNIGVLGMFMQSSASGTEAAIGTGKLGKDCIIPTNALGVYVDTTYYKNFEVRADILAARPGRFVITAYNATGNQLATARAVNFPGVSENANYGGHAYQTGSDTTGTIVFRVDSNVAYVKLMFAPGTNPCAIRGFSVAGYASLTETTGQNNGLSVYGGVFAYQQMLAPAIPTKLGPVYSARGTIIGSTVGASGAASGWQCSLSGYNAADWVNTTVYKLNQIVNNDTGKIYVCVADGTSAGSGGPTGTGQGITDGTVTWNYVGVGLATWTAMQSNP